MTIRVAPAPVRRVRAEWHRPPQRVEQPGVGEIPERAASVGQPAGHPNARRDATPANESPQSQKGETANPSSPAWPGSTTASTPAAAASSLQQRALEHVSRASQWKLPGLEPVHRQRERAARIDANLSALRDRGPRRVRRSAPTRPPARRGSPGTRPRSPRGAGPRSSAASTAAAATAAESMPPLITSPTRPDPCRRTRTAPTSAPHSSSAASSVDRPASGS